MENFKGREDVLTFGEALVDILNQTCHIFNFKVNQSVFIGLHELDCRRKQQTILEICNEVLCKLHLLWLLN